jgi:hypothetical protein
MQATELLMLVLQQACAWASVRSKTALRFTGRQPWTPLFSAALRTSFHRLAKQLCFIAEVNALLFVR